MNTDIKLKGTHTYTDQSRTELYDVYDIRAERTPRILETAEVINESPSGKTVYIDYPIINGIWHLDSELGSCPNYMEAGKKAFVRNGTYYHPEKVLWVNIEMMEPYEYIKRCAKLFTNLRNMYKNDGKIVTPEELVESRLSDYDLNEVFNKHIGNIFYPVLDIRGRGQEGLHRAIWALMNYEKEDIPVIIIEGYQ